MAKDRQNHSVSESTISIIAQGTRITGECETEGSIRIEGAVEGSVRAGKAVVIGKDGLVEGDVFTQDAVIAGTVRGLVIAESRLELQASCRIDGDVRARRMQLEEGAVLNGTIQMGDVKSEEAAPSAAEPELDPPAAAKPAGAARSLDAAEAESAAADAADDPDEKAAEAAQ